MNKKLIALAVASVLAAPLAAQAEVTISGKLQVEVANVAGDGATTEGLFITDAMEGDRQNAGNASAINVSASQDLGGGLKGIAKAGFNLWPGDHNDRDFQGRDAYVGLAGGFGTVLLGTMNTPYKSSTVSWDPFLTTSLQARGSTGMSGLHNGYAQNVIAYANNFGAVKFVAAISLDESDDDTTTPATETVTEWTDLDGDGVIDAGETTDLNILTGGNEGDGDTDGDHATTLSVNVPVGPVEIAAAYLDGGGDNQTAVKVGAKFSTGAFTVAGQYEDLDEGIGNGSHIYVTGSMAMGSNTLSASYGMFSDDSAAGVDEDYLALGVKHAFSKTVSAHVGYRANDTDADNTDVNVFAAGMRVGF